MMQDNFTNQISLQEEESLDIKKEVGITCFFGLILLLLLQ